MSDSMPFLGEDFLYSSGDWTVHEWRIAVSTNDLARSLEPWHLALAQSQTAGRGRMNRLWHSDKGGLWCSFVLPLEHPQRDWTPLPLLGGLALLDTMKEFGLFHARLRWPNDLLVGKAKLAGILAERPSAHKAVLGIGLNLFNAVEEIAALIQDPPTSLSQLLAPCPPLPLVLETLGFYVKARFLQFCQHGLAPLREDLKSAWQEPRPVCIESTEGVKTGLFVGINEDGHPLLQHSDGSFSFVDGAYITRLKEID